MKLSIIGVLAATLAFASCDAAPAYAAKEITPAAKVCPPDHRLSAIEAEVKKQTETHPSITYKEFSPADSAKLIAYINAQPPVEQTYDADKVVALAADKESSVIVDLFKAGCAVMAVRVSRASYDAVLKTVLGQVS